MTNEEMEKAIEFLVNQQAKFFSDLVSLKDTFTMSHTQALVRLDRSERILKMAITAGRRLRSEFRASQSEIKEMREAMREQDKRITAIIDTNHELQDLARQNIEGIKEMRRGIAEMRHETTEMRHGMAELRRIVESGANEMAEMRHGISQMREGIAELRGIVESGANEMTELRAVVKDMTQAIIATNKRIDGLEKNDNNEPIE
jgi:methyl-accepting chemotaxis protein